MATARRSRHTAAAEALGTADLAVPQGAKYSDDMTTMNVDFPGQLYEQVRRLVEEGWHSSEVELVQEAVRRYLEARVPDLMARFIQEDVEWGLRADD